MLTKNHLKQGIPEPPSTWMHPKVRQAWREAGFESIQDIPLEAHDPQLKVYTAWYKQVDIKSRDKIKHEIKQMTRVQDEDGNEWIVYNEDLIGEDRFGDPIRCNLGHQGMYLLPIFEKRYNEETDSKEYTGNVQETKPQFEIEFTKENLAELKKNVNGKTQYYAKNFRTQLAYGPFSPQEFENLTFSELEIIGQEGRTTTDREKTQERREKERKEVSKRGDKALTKRLPNRGGPAMAAYSENHPDKGAVF